MTEKRKPRIVKSTELVRPRSYSEKRIKRWLKHISQFNKNDNWWEEAYVMGYYYETSKVQDLKRNRQQNNKSMKELLKNSEL